MENAYTAYTLEEYMQALVRIGFSQETILEKSLQYAEHIEGDAGNGMLESYRLRRLEEATRTCGIHSEQIREREEALHRTMRASSR